MPVNQRSNPEPKRGICMTHVRMIEKLNLLAIKNMWKMFL